MMADGIGRADGADREGMDMAEKELLQRNVEEFARLQKYLIATGRKGFIRL